MTAGGCTNPVMPLLCHSFDQSMYESLRGHFLLAAKHLNDPNFARTVVLLIEHNDDGAMGVVVNRPSSVSVSNALAEHFDIPDCDESVFIGGPVEPSALFVLHNRGDLDPEESEILHGLYVGGSADAFETIVRNGCGGDEEVQFRIYCGCAGWGAGQLEGEIQRGDWFLLPADAASLFAENPYDLWDDLRQRVHRAPALVPDIPGRPDWN